MLPPGEKKKRKGTTNKKASMATETSLFPQHGTPGRPACDIDEMKVFEMASYDCTVEEIAAHFKCSVTTIYERFSETLRIGKQAGKQKLRQNMERKAYEGGPGDTSLLIWLSKQRLGYRDRAADDVQQVVFNLNIKEIP